MRDGEYILLGLLIISLAFFVIVGIVAVCVVGSLWLVVPGIVFGGCAIFAIAWAIGADAGLGG